MQKVALFFKTRLKSQAAVLGRLLNVKLLTKPQTVQYLAAHAEQLLHHDGAALALPAVASVGVATRPLFPAETIRTASAHVWQYANPAGTATQLRNGSLKLGAEVLDLGFGNSMVLSDLLKQPGRPNRASRATSLLVAPWAYYWAGYFDYMLFAAVAVCRIKEALPAEAFAAATVAYPLSGASFEREIMALLGVKAENLVDTRTTQVAFERCAFGNSDSWFFPNQHDVLAFKHQIERALQLPASVPHRRLYIQRAGRRKVLNESELLAVLGKYSIELVADVPRTFAEQVQLFQSAAFVMGPHGASFANVLWCQPGAQLLELFAPTYVPPYFRYLATALGLTYSAHCPEVPSSSDHSHVADDVVVEISELEEYLADLFGVAEEASVAAVAAG